MNMQPNRALFDADDVVARHERKSLLRFIVCGSVDHGKSTLIGRLLYESGLVLSDQLQALSPDRGRRSGDGGEPDFSLLLDGLAAEREQKITIDVAYRFFATERRRYIVADAPGHEQYTRNMATGASTADLALLLVSANDGLTRQTRRHAIIVSTLGVRRLVVAINKMDLVGWSESRFAELQAEFSDFVRDLDVDDVTFIPLSARDGENLVDRARRMPWYQGPSLLEYLETLEVEAMPRSTGFRMPVQYVNRPDSTFRGYCGLITSGEVYPGMPVRAVPSGQRTPLDPPGPWHQQVQLHPGDQWARRCPGRPAARQVPSVLRGQSVPAVRWQDPAVRLRPARPPLRVGPVGRNHPARRRFRGVPQVRCGPRDRASRCRSRSPSWRKNRCGRTPSRSSAGRGLWRPAPRLPGAGQRSPRRGKPPRTIRSSTCLRRSCRAVQGAPSD